MSRLGLHVTIGNRSGFGDALLRCSVAGSPIPVLQTVDVDLWPDVAQYSPQTRLVFRTKFDAAGREIGDGPQAMYTGEPNAEAEAWMAKMMPRWRLNRAHYYAPINEQDGGPASDMDWLNVFLLRCIAIAQENGFKLAAPNFSTGNPRDDSPISRLVYALFQHRVPALAARLMNSVVVSNTLAALDGNIVPGSAEDRWQRLIPAMTALRDTGGVLTIHQYGLHYGWLMASAPYLALRHRRDLAFLQSVDAAPRIVINEAGPGAGGFHGGINAWLADLAAYDAQLMVDPYVLGACIYQLGGAENIVTGLAQLAGYIAAHPTPPSIDPPQPPPVSQTYTTIRLSPPAKITLELDTKFDRGHVHVTHGTDTDVQVE